MDTRIAEKVAMRGLFCFLWLPVKQLRNSWNIQCVSAQQLNLSWPHCSWSGKCRTAGENVFFRTVKS